MGNASAVFTATPKRKFGELIPFAQKGSVDRSTLVASVLLALEEEPTFRPVVLAVRSMDGVRYVGASIGSHAFRLTSGEARLAADCLWADPVLPGFADVVARLRDAADASDRAFLRGGL